MPASETLLESSLALQLPHLFPAQYQPTVSFPQSLLPLASVEPAAFQKQSGNCRSFLSYLTTSHPSMVLL
jgi:hypothetical protein